jgi:NADP-dependent 3-hydroxy acid dehydrogenase YdfG
LALITGATSGIGRATALEFARHGWRLILTGRRAERLADLKIELERQFPTEVLTLCFDVRQYAEVEQHLGHLPAEWQAVDVLLNNAGLAKGLSPIHEGELRHWEQMIDTNIKGLLYVTRVISPGMVARRSGQIINICSSAGKEVYPNGNVYSATKFAVDALTRSMRLDLHQYGIRVGQVSPGHVEETEFALNRFDGDAQRAQIYNDFQPLTARDVAETIYFLASRPAHVNVQDIYLFGTQQASATVVDRSGR